MSKKRESAFDRFAACVIAGTAKHNSLMREFSLDYRKGKTIEDLKRAIARGYKQGCGKVEFEIGMISVCMRSVLRFVRPKQLEIHCPQCQTRHIDAGEWIVRLHRKHFCEKCGHIWQVSDDWSVGV